jgi:hypothetical protein
VITEAIQLVCFILPINLGTNSLNTTRYCEKNGQKPRHAVVALRAMLPMVYCPVDAYSKSELTLEGGGHLD